MCIRDRLKYYEEIKSGKIVPDGSAPVAAGAASANPISACLLYTSKIFKNAYNGLYKIEKNEEIEITEKIFEEYNNISKL